MRLPYGKAPEWRIGAITWPTTGIVVYKAHKFTHVPGVGPMHKVKMYQFETLGM